MRIQISIKPCVFSFVVIPTTHQIKRS